MGTSFVEYRGRGFWSWDGYLEHALALVASRFAGSADDWQKQLHEHWKQQSSGFFSGFISPRLDDLITTEERRDQLIRVLDDVALQPDLQREARETLMLLKSLLRNEITTDASSPLDYMVNGQFPYHWSVE